MLLPMLHSKIVPAISATDLLETCKEALMCFQSSWIGMSPAYSPREVVFNSSPKFPTPITGLQDQATFSSASEDVHACISSLVLSVAGMPS